MKLSEQLQAELATAGFTDLHWGEPLCHGTSNQNFRVKAQGEEWVLRINNPSTQSLCPRENEVACWRQASAAGIAPELVFVSTDHEIYLSQYIHQPLPWEQCYRDHADTPALLLTMLRQLSDLPLPTRQVMPATQWEYYRRELQRLLPTLSPSLAKIANQLLDEHPWMQACVERLAAQPMARFCHRDLNPNNLLMHQGRLLCIDFEYACTSDPRLELIALQACHQLSDAQSRLLLQGYLPGNGPQQAQHLADARYAYWLFTACWGLIMCADGKRARRWLNDALHQLEYQTSRRVQ